MGGRGTADAVWQNLLALRRHRAHRIIVLAGDHIREMDNTRIVHEQLERDVHQHQAHRH